MLKRYGSSSLISVLLLGGSVALADGPAYAPAYVPPYAPAYAPAMAPHAPCANCPSGPSYPWTPGTTAPSYPWTPGAPIPVTPSTTTPSTTTPSTTTPSTTTPSTTTPGTTTPGATTPGTTTPGTNAAQPEAQDQNAANNQNGSQDAAFNQAPGAGTSGTATSTPQMLGDQLSSFRGNGFITVHSIVDGSSTTDRFPFKAPLISQGAFKIAENESPAPEDRVFVNFQYYNNVLQQVGPASDAATAVSPHTLSVYRETLGFEKTILDGNASIGLRVPLIQTTQAIGAAVLPGLGGGSITGISDGLDGEQFGDISVVFKYALYKDCCTGNTFSTGVVVTAPTGQELAATDGTSEINPVLIQPYIGWIYCRDKVYVHGFTSCEAPTDLRVGVELFNDIGVGYRLYKACPDTCGNQFLTGITPTVEAHINTPLTHRGLDAPYFGLTDAVDITAGVHLDFGRARLTVGASTPVTGPQPYDIEGIAQLNWRF